MFIAKRLKTSTPALAVCLAAAIGAAGGGVVPARGGSSPYAPSNGLGHYWALDEDGGTTAVDSIGAQPGTLMGGPAWQPLAGRFGGAVELDGADDRIDLGTMDAPSTSAMSITLWLNADDFDVPDARLVSKATGTQEGDHYWMVSTIDATGVRFRLKTDGATTTLATGAGEVSAGEWYHVAVTYDGAAMRIYRDGTEVANAPKSGVIDVAPAVGVAMGNQPAGVGDKAFDGLIDDVRVYERALDPAEIAAMVPPKPPFTFTLWYGEHQPVGQRGTPQQWVNVLGAISQPADVDSLFYRLRGGPPSVLSAGPDGFRLADAGDFNVEIDTEDLIPGPNAVTISGVHFDGKRADTTVTVDYTPGVAWDLPDTLRFTAAADLLDVVAVVDGGWDLVPGGVRTSEGMMGYDRLLAAGQRHWGGDFEVLVPITIHDYETVFPDNGPAVGVGFGWQGHTGSGQPRGGHPYQAIGFIRGLASSPYLQLMKNGDIGVAVVPAVITTNTRYLMRIRSETQTATTSRVRMKVWEDGAPEPGAWQIQDDFTTRGGSILLIAHRADVTFGDTVILPLDTTTAAGDTPPPARLSVYANAPNPFGGDTALRVRVTEATPVQIDVFDVRGRRVHRRTVPVPGAGVHELSFHAAGLPSGVYFYRVTALGATVTRKMVVSR